MKPWKDLSPEEKGALLLASHEGRTLQYWQRGTGGWADCNSVAGIHDHEFYRVKPEPVVEEVVMYTSRPRNRPPGWGFTADNCEQDRTHKITFNLVDSVIDCSSVKMEKLK